MTAPDDQMMPPSPEPDAHSAAIPPLHSEAGHSQIEPIDDLDEEDDDEFEDDDDWDDDEDDDDEFDDWEDEDDDETEDAEDPAK